MPWMSKTLLEARSEFVQLALAPNANIQSLCWRFNVSRQTGYRTLERYRIAGASGLEGQSRRPHHTPNRCPDPTDAAVLTVRADHPTWGARKIAFHLRSMGCTGVPALSTITAILVRHNHLKGSPAQGRFLRLRMIRAGIVAGLTEWKNRKNSGMVDAVAQSLADATISHFTSQLGAVEKAIAQTIDNDSDLRRKRARLRTAVGDNRTSRFMV